MKKNIIKINIKESERNEMLKLYCKRKEISSLFNDLTRDIKHCYTGYAEGCVSLTLKNLIQDVKYIVS
jgi:hypothetical protein